jgi:hypothetical protein
MSSVSARKSCSARARREKNADENARKKPQKTRAAVETGLERRPNHAWGLIRTAAVCCARQSGHDPIACREGARMGSVALARIGAPTAPVAAVAPPPTATNQNAPLNTHLQDPAHPGMPDKDKRLEEKAQELFGKSFKVGER